MKLTDSVLLVFLAAIWGSSFIFMRATAQDFGPVVLIALRIGIATLCLFSFLLLKKRWQEFIQYWKILVFIGLVNSALPFVFLAYASLFLNAGLLSIINATTPIFTALVAHFWLKDKMTLWQLIGMVLGIIGIMFLVWDKLNWNTLSWLPILAAIMTTVSYGISANATKKYLHQVSPMTATAGSLFFATLFMFFLSLFFLPNFSTIPALSWSYVIILGVFCTALAYLLFFKLIQSAGPAKASTVTFIVPIFAFIWAYLLLDEIVTNRMWIATLIILIGTSLVTGIISPDKSKK